MMNRTDAIEYVGHCVDDALAVRTIHEIPKNARLVGWQCGLEPMFVAVWSYLPDVRLDESDAVEIASDYLSEIGWFVDEVTEADYVI